ncbi:MAG: ABC transporter substrate-binding protein [Bdellovibrionaceae bacterium]|nr:ABC transporter substrate-binding protein [Pseudobdellovibrionaceae bacterium]
MHANQLEIPLPAEKIVLDPQLMQDAWSMHVVLQIHRGLFRFLPDGTVKPDLVESFTESNDGKSLTVRLKTATFSDGSPLKSDHVVNTFRRLFHLQASIAADLSMITGAMEAKSGKETSTFGVQRVDERTVRINLATRNALLKSLIATPDCSILKVTDDLKVNSEVGLGPYRIRKKTEKSLSLDISPNRTDHNKNPPTNIVYRFGVKTIDAFPENIVIDHYELPQEKIAELLSRGWTRSVGDATRERFLMMNQALAYELRKAIFYIINQEKLAAEVNVPSILPAYGLIPYGLPGAKTKKPWTKQATLAPNTKPLEMIFPNTWPDGTKISNAVETQLRKAGIDVSSKKVSFEEWMTKKNSGQFDIIINARGLDFPDSYAILSYFKSGFAQNYLRLNDPQIDQLLDEAIQELDFHKRVTLYDRIEQLVLDKFVVVPLLFGASNSALWPPVAQQVPAHPLGFHYLPLELVEMKHAIK